MESKKKDLMSASLEDFWKSDYNIPQHKINTPRVKTTEDNSWDILYGRGQYVSKPKVVPIQRVNYVPQVNHGMIAATKPLTQEQTYQIAKERLKLQQIQAKQQLRASQTRAVALGGVIRAGRYGANVGIPYAARGIRVTSGAIKSGIPYVKSAVGSAKSGLSSLANRFKKKTIPEKHQLTNVKKSIY